MSLRLNHVLHASGSDSPALLLVHPLGADLGFWDECIALWRPRISCIAVDLRSAGRSPSGTGPVSIARHVEDLEALRRELGIRMLVPIGCAVGAMTAASYAATHPESTAALVMASPTARTSDTAKRMLAERAHLVRQSGMSAVLPGAVDKAFSQQPRDNRYRSYYESFAAQDADHYAASVLGVLDADVTKDLTAIRCPVLVVAAGHDVLLPPEQARHVHGLVARAEFELLERAAHFAPFQAPQQFSALVLSFLLRAAIVREAGASTSHPPYADPATERQSTA